MVDFLIGCLWYSEKSKLLRSAVFIPLSIIMFPMTELRHKGLYKKTFEHWNVFSTIPIKVNPLAGWSDCPLVG
jgi:hypothetical protein